jgi:methionyl-tRNA formyltransferase
MGTPAFATAQLKRLCEEGFNICAVVTAPDKPSGRGLKIIESDVKKFAVSAGIPVLQPISLRDPEFLEKLSSYKPDLNIVVAFRMLPKVVWSMPTYGTFNLHASLLPHYRGAAPINWALINGEKESGVTTFMIDDQIDTGAIIFYEKCRIEEDDNFGTLHDKLMNLGSDLVIKTVNTFIDGNLVVTLQSSIEAQLGDVRSAPKLNRENTRIDWTRDITEICNLIRGLSPYPSAYGTLTYDNKSEGTEIKIFEAKACHLSIPDNHRPGDVITDFKTYFKVRCADGYADVLSLQAAGKRRMTAKEFLMGFRSTGHIRFL